MIKMPKISFYKRSPVFTNIIIPLNFILLFYDYASKNA